MLKNVCKAMKNINILLVEDNEVNQIVASTLLKRWGIGVTIAPDGKQALILIQEKRFQLVLMDLQMPEMDGFESTKQIRALEDQYFKNVPIIAFTASSMISSRESAMAFGMTDFVSKPLDPQELQEKIDSYLVLSKNHSAGDLLQNIDFDLLTEGDTSFKCELLCSLIDNLQELKQSLEHTLSEQKPQVFISTSHKVAPTLDILNDKDLHRSVESLKTELGSSAFGSVGAMSKKFYTFCDQFIQALHREVVSTQRTLLSSY
jgi:CheY-like chemotaxis protein